LPAPPRAEPAAIAGDRELAGGRVMQTLWKAWAFFKRDLLTDLSYRFSFAVEGVHVLLMIASYYFLARFVGEKTPGGYSPFPFMAVGIAVNGYMTTCLACFAQAIRGGQTTGTLKVALATPTSPAAFIGLSSIYPCVRAAVDAALYLLGSSLFGLPLGRVNLPSVVVLFVLSTLVFSSVGILSATFTLLFKRGDPVLWVFVSLSWLLGGVFYPVDALPPLLQRLAWLLPVTHVLDGARAAVLSGSSPGELVWQIGALTVFAVAGLPASVAAFHLGVRRAKTTGTLGQF
jgi:ABC-2 type transport system permease protein